MHYLANSRLVLVQAWVYRISNIRWMALAYSKTLVEAHSFSLQRAIHNIQTGLMFLRAIQPTYYPLLFW